MDEKSSGHPTAEKPIPTSPMGAGRRGFVKKIVAATIGVFLAAVPVGAGLTVFLSPLRRKSRTSQSYFIAMLDALPADGTPCKFPVKSTRVDAWNKSEGLIGAVYLRRIKDTVHALNVACPHAGCFVEYSAARTGFVCPCHNSCFGLDGSLGTQKSPSPRPLDTLEVEVRDKNQVWVKFQNFRAGEAKKIAL